MATLKFPNREDQCPLCGSKDLDYPNGAQIHDFPDVSYNTVCSSCGASWVQWYKLCYDTSTDVRDNAGKLVKEEQS